MSHLVMFSSRFSRTGFIGIVGIILLVGCQPRQQWQREVRGQIDTFLLCLIPHWSMDSQFPLQPTPDTHLNGCGELRETLGRDEKLWGEASDRETLLVAIDRSLQYLNSSSARRAYRRYPIPEITRDRVLLSLQRFRALLLESDSPQDLQAKVQREFVFYQAIGSDRLGTVLFSAYFEPIYPASRLPTSEYRYPIYQRPPNLNRWPLPHPPRKALEGEDGLQGSRGKLKGLELFWLRSRWEAYLIHIQGSAKLNLTDGTQTTVGYAGNTRKNYTSIGGELAKDGKIPLEELTLPRIFQYFDEHPEELNDYLTRDESFVFFAEKHGTPATGSIGVSLSAKRSIATDKRLMPPGALALIHTAIPEFNARGELVENHFSRYVLDQDTGGAIKGAGRVDYFVGSGEKAGTIAGLTRSYGQLYYLLLK
ncbi:MAG: murein transglycosylase A [Spirulina sp.]